MLVRINQIKNVGVFKEDKKIKNDFDELNLIYGSNASGKSTLTDILKDLSDSEDSRIRQRQTIDKEGSIADKQFIKIISKINSKENNIIYKDKKWGSNNLKNKIFVFDTEFVQNNIFSGLELLDDRKIEENFSGFILGNDAVQKASELSVLKKKLSEERKLLKTLIPESQEGENEKTIKSYIDFKVNEEKQELEKEKIIIKTKILEENKILDNAEKISLFNEILPLSMSKITEFTNIQKKILQTISKTYSIDINDINNYEDHIKNHFSNYETEEAESWIEKGLKYLENGDECPFCGQDISDIDLILKYRNIFNEDYASFSNLIYEEIAKYKNVITNIELSNQSAYSKIEFNKAVKLFGEEIRQYSEKLDKCSKNIEDFVVKKKDSFKKEKNDLLVILDNKKVYINGNFNFDFSNINNLIDLFENLINEYNNVIDDINIKIKLLKEKSIKQDDKNLIELKDSLTTVENKLTRIEEDSQCNKWKIKKFDIDLLSKEIEDKSKALESSQNDYLNKYFESINYYFNKFDGRKFKIKSGKVNNKGYKKTIGVDISFNNCSITSNIKTSKIFSESDRRALALSVFIAKLDSLLEEELRDLIIVFDDPVTSFDSNRYSIIAKTIIEIVQKVNQVFVLSHQYDFCKNMHDRYGNKTYDNLQNPMRYFEIKKEDNNYSVISDLDYDKFFNSEFIKKYEKIIDFIEGNRKDLTQNDLRVFLEEYLRITFTKIHSEEFIPSKTLLGKRIEKLYQQGYINNKIKDEFLIYKDTLNPKSHNFDDSELGDKQSIAADLLEYLDDNFRII